ncbi:hyphally-regulated protein-like [Camellia sinensis]|uniref:hyphally-regulated protein-like n=1 Tax=Camellia sinensis TaxID=4442 RepID=UPI0010366AC6|nr:hyphally-regulated protein-like [Camellia sinensis]
MPPLAGVRAPTGRTANNASSSRARTVGVPSTSRARAPRGETRGMPSTRRCVGWPDPPTELTSWRISRVLYQILLEPPLPDHRYVRTPGSPPPSVEYVEGLLQVMASFEGIILRREMMLTSHRIPVTPLQTGPSESSRAVEREISAHSRGRCQKPITCDDNGESSEEEEPASPQSESFEGGGDGTGSGSEGGDDAVEGSEEGSGGDSGSGSSLDSDGGADGDDAESAQPRKMMKRASQS